MIKRIVIRTPNFIGDTVMMLPALDLVRKNYPDSQITIICRPQARAIFRNKGIYNIIEDDTKGKQRFLKTISLLKELRKETYDLGILFHNSFLSALLFKLGKVRTIIGYEKEGRKILLDYHEKILRSRHYVNHYAHLVNSFLGNIYTKLPPMKLQVGNDSLVEKSNKFLIGFVLGGDNKGMRKYPVDQSLKLFSLLANEQIKFVFLGDSLDSTNHQKYAEYLSAKGGDVLNLTGKTTVSEFIDTISKLDLLVTIDTSAMHISAATDTPFLVLRGVGTSAFDTVFPKESCGDVLFKGEEYIEDYDAIKAIKPRDIYDIIIRKLNKNSYL